MNRSFYSLLALVVAACAASESAPASDGTGLDSTMVVAPAAMVPYDDRPVVVFLGTSLTAGMGLERDADGYVSVLSVMADSAGKPFRAVNAGVSGETSAGGLRRLDWVLRQPFDVLFLELGANDGLRGQDPRVMASNLTEIIRRTRTRYPDVRVVVAGMEAPPNLGELYTSAFRQVFPTVATAEETELIPFLLDGVAGIPELNQEDRIHPTAEGHRKTAAHAWPTLERVLDSLPDRDELPGAGR